MNTFDKVVMLAEKGFTKAEIDAMLMTTEPEEPVEPETVASPEPTPAEPELATEPTQEPEPTVSADDPVPETLPAQLSTFMDEMRQSIATLTAAVQARNIQTSSVDTTRPEDLNDFLAAYINPPKNK